MNKKIIFGSLVALALTLGCGDSGRKEQTVAQDTRTQQYSDRSRIKEVIRRNYNAIRDNEFDAHKQCWDKAYRNAHFGKMAMKTWDAMVESDLSLRKIESISITGSSTARAITKIYIDGIVLDSEVYMVKENSGWKIDSMDEPVEYWNRIRKYRQ